MKLNEDLNTNRNDFIEKSKKFIHAVTAKICKKNLQWENDDELSIALIAFNKACESYIEDKGNFFSYSKVLIKNSLIDYFRKNSNNPYLTFDDENSQLEYIDNKNSLTNYEIEQENLRRSEEIIAFNNELQKYNLSFEVLASSSPTHRDTKDKLLTLAFICSKESSILEYIHKSKMIPVKQICILTNSNRKLIEKWRRYILALILILSNEEYAYIRSYLNIKVGEKD
ncbi:RNA polymerase subunit sigma-28 [Clostridium sp. PL3]|uniref:RNA polymerase sigma factor SigI n=1 Tax=Clostridium thailandense TaxID=2794346 RepID=A0A949X4I2_9CLOT|nr:sigma factor [Clostridium thailandense]MBV7274038.1 RNA polymerase subunit sigma-28 [Clostridium thailandense]